MGEVIRRWVVSCLLGASVLAAQSPPENTIRVSGGVMAARVLSKQMPMYPEDAKAAGIQGTVVLSVKVAKTGLVDDAEAISGPEKLRDAAKAAVSRWIYRAYQLNGQPVAVSTIVTVNFSLGVAAEEGAGAAFEAPKSDQVIAATGSATPAPGEAAPPMRLGVARVSSGVMAGYLTQKANPVYPKDAKRAHISGSVVLHAIISKSGDIKDLVVISGPEKLRESALTAVRQWKYAPYIINGEPTEVDTQITVNYMFSERPQGERDKWESVQ